MTKKFTHAFLCLMLPVSCMAQATAEKKDIRIYEHHSSSINDGAPFGSGGNGEQSGYDFVNHTYYNSFNPATFDAWSAAEIANIDMVEHKGPFGGGGSTSPFGFTSGTSSIWAGDIKGNNLTTYAEAPAGFNYDMATDVNYIREAFPAGAAANIDAVVANKVYLARIRGTETYVAMKVKEVKNLPPGASVADVYFNFDYKYGTYSPTAINDIDKAVNTFSIVPNPSKGSFAIAAFPADLDQRSSRLSIVDMTGRTVHAQAASTAPIALQLPAGNYMLLLTDGHRNYSNRLTIAE